MWGQNVGIEFNAVNQQLELNIKQKIKLGIGFLDKFLMILKPLIQFEDFTF